MASMLHQLNRELSDVVAETRRSVVQVLNDRGGAGAGTVWHSDGLILTNAHVVRGGSIKVAIGDPRKPQIFPAEVIARDDERDLAALAVRASGLPTITPGSARSLKPGAWVFAVGHPWGIANAATGGVVIGMGNPIPGMSDKPDWVMIDLKLRPGNSGGPLVDVGGRIVGVNTIMTGILGGAAVSVDAAKHFLRDMLGSAPEFETVVAPEASAYV